MSSVKAWENGPSYIDMPKRMDTYSAPALPDPDKLRRLEGARETMRWLQTALVSARDRVVIKRRVHDPVLGAADWQIIGRAVRYDVYRGGVSA